ARMGGLFGAIRDAMPDSWGRKVIERHLKGRLDDMDYLLRAPDDRAGALGFGLNAEAPSPENRFNRTLDLERLQRAADAVIKDDPDLAGSAGEQAEDLLLLGTSMGGARPKAVVQDDEAQWIAKFARDDDRYNYPRIEHALLELAKACGLSAADIRLTTVADRDVLLVRRFDRDRAQAGYLRHRMISAVTLLRTNDDSVARTNWSYLLLADEIRRVSAEPAEDLRELFTRMCFNAAVSNLDDHPRNHAILAKERSWRLSPAYDLTPQPVIARENRDLAMECGLRGRGANQTNLTSGHGRFLLSREVATDIFDTVIETVSNQWRAAMRRAGVSDQDCERISGAFLYDGLFYGGE
ncbi:MAG: HipA domain-containing protein, partial [Gammaproteobacteria bacterium]|nr:HipA domain-containing protein [Gammaproteobacteria bacterium]